MKRVKTEKNPTFIDQLKEIGMNEKSIEDMTFSYADHQYLSRLMNIRDISITDETKEYIKRLYLADNEALCKNVADIVSEKLAESMDAWHRELGEIAMDIKEIKIDLNHINIRLKSDEDLLKGMEHRIIRLEKYASLGWTIVRNLITVAVSISVAIILFLEIHSRINI